MRPIFRFSILGFWLGWLLAGLGGQSYARTGNALDSLRRELVRPGLADSSRVMLLCQLSDQLWTRRTDSATIYAQYAFRLARRSGFRAGEGEALNRLGGALRESNLARALEMFQQSLHLAEAIHDRALQAQNLRSIGILHIYLRDEQQGLHHYFQALRLDRELHDQRREVIELSNIGLAYDLFGRLDSASAFQEQAYRLAQRLHTPTNYILVGLGNIARKRGQLARARAYYQRAMVESEKLGQRRSSNFAYVGLAMLYQQAGRIDSSIYYARLGCHAAQQNGFLRGVLNASTLLTQDFQQRRLVDSAFKYQSLLLAMKDTLFGQEKVARLQNVNNREQEHQQQAAIAQAGLRAQYRTYALLGGLAGLLVLAGLLLYHSREQQRANQALAQSLAELNATQEQLVQREKMAFLGELTAGVAHELQNPLSFVKNFADVSTSLLDEISAERADSSRKVSLEQEILAGLKQNLQEISQHGQRATAIIKGMLEHSRASTAPRELTDLNALVSENLELAYKGLRTQHQGFTADLAINLTPSLPPIWANAQDLGRVVLNLCSNALYAVRQRQLEAVPRPAVGNTKDYQPAIVVSTRPGPNGSTEICVRDNGAGMSATIREQIFEPFFTTKPVGEGTGLGLSLSHDIVTSGHGGSLRVASTEGEGTEFVVTLPWRGASAA